MDPMRSQISQSLGQQQKTKGHQQSQRSPVKRPVDIADEKNTPNEPTKFDERLETERQYILENQTYFLRLIFENVGENYKTMNICGKDQSLLLEYITSSIQGKHSYFDLDFLQEDSPIK
jgi:hypothetical protein